LFIKLERELEMKMFLRNLLVFAVVVAAPVYISACASNKAQKQGAVGESEQTADEKAKAKAKEEAEAAAQEKAKAEELSRQSMEEQAKQKEEAMSPAFIEKLKTIHFDYDKAEIKPEDRENLANNAETIKAHPTVHVVIEGHCDERGTDEYNLALGERRARTAKKYLVSLGVNESNLSTMSYGVEKPVDPGHNEEAWAKNRRAEFTQK